MEEECRKGFPVRRVEVLVRSAAGKDARDRYEQDRADRGGGEAAKEPKRDDTQARENPAADYRADETQNNVGDAAEAAAAGDGTGEPSSDEADENPPEDAVGFDVNDPAVLRGGKLLKYCCDRKTSHAAS